MALVSRSSKCFKAVETALEAVKSGNIYSSGIILKSIKQDGLLLQQDVSALSIQLRQAEAEHQLQVESLTRQINELYQVQIKCKERQGELEERKFSLINAKNCYSHSKQVALRNYQEAREEQREAERKYDEFRFLFWVPIVGWILTVRELIQENGNRASDAYGEMLRYENDIERADSDIEWANDSIFEAEKEINEIVWKVGKLKRQREECHEKLGGVKSTRSFVMQAATFWDEVVNLTKTATVKTEHIQRILELAARKNSVRILTSKGTQIKVASFKEHWMEVAEMISSGVNNRLFNGKGFWMIQ